MKIRDFIIQMDDSSIEHFEIYRKDRRLYFDDIKGAIENIEGKNDVYINEYDTDTYKEHLQRMKLLDFNFRYFEIKDSEVFRVDELVWCQLAKIYI